MALKLVTMNFITKSIISITCINLFSCGSGNEQKTKESISIDNDSTVVLTTFSKRRFNVQNFEINPAKQNEIIGEQGTVVLFPANCFGKPDGKVNIELIECYSIQNMLLNGISTQTSNGKLLESEGMIFLNAVNEVGDTLGIRKGNIKVKMITTKAKEGIKLFDGVENGNYITWNLSGKKLIHEDGSNNKHINKESKSSIIISASKDSLYRPIFSNSQILIDKKIKSENIINYVFNISKMGWINCDRYIEGETAPLIVFVPKESIGASYYLVLKNYNSSVPPKLTSNGKLSFMVPINEPFTIVALGSKGEDFYFKMIDYSGNKNEVVFTELTKVTRQQMTNKLMDKFGKNIWNRPLS